MATLVPATDAHFTWMLRADPAETWNGLSLPAGGVADAAVVMLLRGVAARLRAASVAGSFLVEADGVVVGLCGLKAPPRDGVGEFGYGIAERCRGQGHATDAVRRLVAWARDVGTLHTLVAETSPQNLASEAVLSRVGFRRNGVRLDPEDGEVAVWTLSLI